jgi:thymidylate synthase
MNHNYQFNNVNDALPRLMEALLGDGAEFPSRAGNTKELMHVGITLRKPWQREIVLPGRKANIAAQIMETMWVLSGRNDVAGLSHYLPRAIDFSDDGLEWRAGYGPRLRNFHGVDQLAYLVDTIADSPGSRQAVASIWDPTVDTEPGKDIACNNWISLSARDGKLDVHVGLRSNDAMWGWSGINAFEWSVLQEVVAHIAGLEIGSLHFSTTSFHLYEQHWDKASSLSKLNGNFMYGDSPRFNLSGYNVLSRFDELAQEWFALEEDIRFGREIGNAVNDFPEPMLRSWLRVLQWYWSGESIYLQPLRRSSLYHACLEGVKPAGKHQEEQLEIVEPYDHIDGEFLDFVNRLHTQKHLAYGDSWKRRGEYMILANIARKVDRIESGKDTPDETQADTAQDLMVYLAKYKSWLSGGEGNPDEVRLILRGQESLYFSTVDIVSLFDNLENAHGPAFKMSVVDKLLSQAYTFALSLW